MMKWLRNLFGGSTTRALASELGEQRNRLLIENSDLEDQNRYLQEQLEELRKEYKSLESELSRAMEQVVLMESYKNRMKDIETLLNEKPREVYIMSPEIFSRLEKSMEAGVVTKETSAQQTGYLLGIQRVLAYLRQNHVASR